MKLIKSYKQPIIGFVFILVILNFGCRRVRKDVVPDSMVTGKTLIAADEALLPLVNAEIDVFTSQYNFATIDCSYGSEYDAINLLLQEKTRLAIIARPLNQTEIDYFKARKLNSESISLAYDAIALIVSSDNEAKALTLNQISKILSGELKNWNQISQTKKEGSIQMIFDSESSGILRSLNDSLHLNKKISGDIRFAGSNKNIIDSVAANKNAIGFIGYNWLSEKENPKVQSRLTQVKVLGVSNGLIVDSINSIEPTIESVYNLNYPLTRKIYAIYTDPSASLARGFLAHLTSERGQKIIYRMGLKPDQEFQRQIKINKDY